jgi:oligoribonuclease (3'-5' exoribonuclease)
MNAYLAIDIETSGLSPERNQILEIGAVLNVLDKPIMECPTFYATVWHETIVGSLYALKLNASLIARLADGEGKSPGDVGTGFRSWLHNLRAAFNIEQFHLLGKNVGSFDKPFLEASLPYWPFEWFSYRCLEVGSMYATPEGIPSQSVLARTLTGCFPGEEHNALYDARVSLALARDKWGIAI